MSNDSILKFPCQFTLKVIGKTNSDFESEVIKILEDLCPDFDKNYQNRPSRDGNYLALTFCFEAQSKEQLDKVYLAITACKDVVMAL